MKVILDCFGGDNCPNAAVEGGIQALNAQADLQLIMCGDEKKINELLAGKTYDKSRLEILNAEEVITNDDVPTLAIRRKKNSSMVVGLNFLSANNADAMVSSGSTGALLVGASILVKVIDGVTRASLTPVMPVLEDGKVIAMVDGGANTDCRASMLKEFAIMGDAYMRACYDIESPRIGLLSNGVEEEKGNELTKETHALLKETKLNFVGNVEARDLLGGVCDVVVTDGFCGNMVIKASEGMAKAMFTLIKNSIMKGGLKAKIGYLLLKDSLRQVKHKFSSDEVGGGVFLGIKKVVVKAHGSSNEKAFKNAVIAANKMARNDIVGKITQGLKENHD